MFDGYGMSSFKGGWSLRGLRRATSRLSYESGIQNGDACGGIKEGVGGRLFGVGSTLRGASLRGSTDFL